MIKMTLPFKNANKMMIFQFFKFTFCDMSI